MKLLYLTFLEGIFNSGIFESQVKTLLFTLKRKYGTELDLLLIVNMPIIIITRRGPVFNFIKYRKEKKRVMLEFKRQEADLKIVPVFLPIINRWGMHLNIFLLALVYMLNFPLLIFTILKFRPEILHCRSYPATLLGLLIKLCSRKCKIIFDMRGLFPEEGIIKKVWSKNSISFKMWKKLEYLLLRYSDKIIVLSESFREYVSFLSPSDTSKIALIYASVDTRYFTSDINKKEILSEKLGLKGKKVFIYHGSLNSWHNPNILAIVFKKIKEYICDAHLFVLTTYNHDILDVIFKNNGLLRSEYTITKAKYSEVPNYLSVGRYSIIPSNDFEYPQKNILDTMVGLKVSESLSIGLPIIANENIGGLRHIFNNHEIGMTFNLKNINNISSKIDYLESVYENVRLNCIKFARINLNIENSASDYYKVYTGLVD